MTDDSTRAARPGGFDPRFFSRLAAVEDRHFWFRARNELVAALARQVVAGLSPGYRVLEVGCGTGNTLRALRAACPGGRLIGLDLHSEGLAVARQRVRAPLLVADVCRSPFRADARFSLIGAFDVLEHIPDDQAVLAALAALLAPDGSLVLTVPAGPSLWSYFDEAARHCRRYEADELGEKLGRAGLDVLFLSPVMMSLYPAVRLRRWLGSRRRRQGEPAERLVNTDLRVRPLINGCLTLILRQELKLAAARRRLPFGTSLVAVARAHA